MNQKPNFYLKYRQSGKIKSQAKTRKIFFKLLPFIFVLLMLVFATVYMQVNLNDKQTTLDEYLDYINNPANITEYETAKTLETENDVLRASQTTINQILETVNSYPRPNRAVKNQLEKIAASNGLTISITSYNASTGLLTFDTVSENADYINSFIRQINQSGLFSNAKYTGYSELGSQAGFKVDLICYLNEYAGK